MASLRPAHTNALVELDWRSSRPNDHGGQEWVRTPLRAPHLPGVVTYNAVLLPCLNAKIRMSVDVLCRMKSPFMPLVAHSIGAARI